MIEEREHPHKETGFDRFKLRYLRLLEHMGERRGVWTTAYLVAAVLVIGCAFYFIGTDILPKANSHQFQLRLRAADGTRVERTEETTLKVLGIIRETVGAENVEITSAYVGNIPSSYGTSQIFVFNSGPHEAVLQVSLKGRLPRSNGCAERRPACAHRQSLADSKSIVQDPLSSSIRS